MRAATTEIDGAFQAITRSLAISEYRDGTGSIGIIGTVVGADVTLTRPADIVNFEIGQTIKSSTSPGVGEQAGDIVIAAINRSTGVITASGNWSAGIATIANGQSIHVAGDFNKKISGLAAWIPLTDPGATPFFGVDRSVDVTRLGGVRKDVSSLPIEEALIDVDALLVREGGTPDYCFLDTQNFANLEKALGSKVQFINVKDEEGIVGFDGIAIHGQKGKIKVIPDQNAFSDRFFMLQMDSWKLYSLGMAPKLLKSDGMEFLRVSNDDAVEVRVGLYGQQGCNSPGWNAVGKLA